MKRLLKTLFLILQLCLMTFFLARCGGYDGYEDENGRLAVIQQANLYLNSAMCDEAVGILTPLYWSTHVDDEVRMTLASAYACKASFSFPNVISSLKSGGNDIFSILVKAMYSDGNDNHLTNFEEASRYIKETTKVAGNIAAANRTADANLYMILMQSGALSSVLSVLGAANSSTGAKTQVVSGAAATTKQRCVAQVAVATINDSLDSLGSSSTLFGSLTTSIDSVCSSVGVSCTNLDPVTCDGSVALQLVGVAVLDAINSSWSF